jgi:hypothetical protein
VIAVATLAPQLRLLHGLEALASETWDFKDMKQAVDSRASANEASLRIPTRLGHLQDGHLCSDVFTGIRDLMLGSPMYDLLRPHERTIAQNSTALAILSRVCGATYQLLASRHRGFPFRLWGLLEQHTVEDREALAKELLDTPVCLKDPYAKRFLRRFHTVAKLCSDEAMSLLFAVG